MRKLTLLLTFTLSFILSFAGDFEKEVDYFTSVSASGNFKVFLVKGEENSIVVENKDDELTDERVVAIVKGSELSLSIQSDAFKKWDLTITVTYTKLLNVHAKKGAWIEGLSPLSGDELELSCTGDGVIKAELDCETVNCSIFTSGTMRLTGKAKIADYKVSTGGFISGIGVTVETVVAKVSTGGEISCYATKKIDMKVNTGGTIKYKYDGDAGNLSEKVVITGDIKKIQD